MKILITGAAGFVGSNLLKRLIECNYDVTGCDDLSFGDIRNVPNEANFKHISFSDINVSNYDILIHCACANIIYAQDHPIETFKINAYESIKLFERFKGYVIYTSTASVYGQADIFPTKENAKKKVYNAYDQSKLIAEHYLQLRGNHTTLRLSNVYGPGQRPDNPYSGVIGKFIESAKENKPMKIYGDGLHTRDYTYIDDVIEAIMVVLKKPFNDVFNVATGNETPVIMLAHSISFLMGKKSNMEFIEPRKIDCIERRCLNTAWLESLGWTAKVDLKEGLLKTIDWNKNN